MASPPSIGLSLCAGGGGLDMGLGLAEPGFATACFVEIEEYPRAVLAAAQAAGYFHTAPIWDDLKRFSGLPWRGICDTLLAGYPCQPFSAAGQRKGERDPRHLWPDVARIIGELQPEWVFLENVPGHVTLGLETVLRTLWDMGFTPAVGLFSAAEVGAPHERLRVFIVAHRDSDGLRKAKLSPLNASGVSADGGGDYVDHPTSARCDGAGIGSGADLESGERLSGDGRDAMGHPARLGRREGLAKPSLRGGWDTVASTGGTMADAEDADRWGEQQARGSGSGWPGPSGTGATVADTSGARTTSRGAEPHRRQQGVATIAIHDSRPVPHFPPGPSDSAAWADTLAVAPDLAPATGLADCLAWASRLAASLGQQDEGAAQSRLCGMADGLATRSRQLRLLGNGVLPLAAGYAWRTLSAAHGLGHMDLGTANEEGAADAG